MPAPRFLLSIAALILALALGAGCSRPAPGGGQTGAGGAPRGPQAQPVEVTEATRRDLIETLRVVGSIEANESAEIRSEIPGIVQQILFLEGENVSRGQLLVKIDDTELRAQFAQVEARFQLAELNVARNESLVQARTIPQSELDRARTEFASARAELALLRARLEKTEIRAPFDGVVGSRTISPGDFVTANTVITSLNDLSRLKVTFQVPERFRTKVAPGTPFRVDTRTLAGAPAVAGEVYFVSPVIDRSTRSSEVKGLLEDPPAVLKPGMFANVELVLEVRRNVLTVPEGAILASPQGPRLVVVDPKADGPVARIVPVTLGLRAGGYVQIEPQGSDLPDPLEVVAAGVGSLTLFPGARLEPRPLSPLPNLAGS
jgi:membrane fusion protein (multidrug efflux system)